MNKHEEALRHRNIKITDRVRLERHSGGSDWGTERLLLVIDRRNEHRLVWWCSHKSWMDRMSGYQHTPASLILEHKNVLSQTWRWEKLHSGGRLSRAILVANQKTIVDFFGTPDVALYLRQAVKYTLELL